MKESALHHPLQHHRAVILVLALAAVCPQQAATAAVVNLGTAAAFAVLAGAGITNTGPTTITGDVGTFPTPSMTGFGSVILFGTNQAGNAVTQTAKADLATAYDDAAGRSHFVEYAGAFDLVGQILIPGVYRASSSLFLSGTVTLDAQGDLNAIWIFQTGSSLITASGSTVALLNGARACNVLWQVGSDATLGTDSDFVGDILALSSITLNTRATVDGRVLARNGAVTMDTNAIAIPGCQTVPEPAGTGLAAFGIVTLFAARRRHALAGT